MIRNLIFACALAMFSASVSASESRWFILFEFSDSKEADFVDGASIVRSGDTLTLWSNQIFNPDYQPKLKDGQIMSQWRIDCGRRTHQVLSAIVYDWNGSVKYREDKPGPAQTAIPDSFGAKALSIYCAKNFPTSDGKRLLWVPGSASKSARDWFLLAKPTRGSPPGD